MDQQTVYSPQNQWEILQTSSDIISTTAPSTMESNICSGFSLLSPQSQSSTYSMDSGYSGLLEATSTSPSQSTTVVNHQASASSSFQAFGDYNDHESFLGCGSEFYVQHQSPLTVAYPPFMSPSTATVPTNTFTTECATLNVNPSDHLKPCLEIVEQPTDKPFRFRYKSEMHGTHGSLMGVYTERSKRTYPTVALRNFNFASKAIIRCSLYQVPNETEKRSPHSHQLVIRRGEIEESDPHDFEVSSQNDFTVSFQGMGIIHTAKRHIKEELYKKIRKELKFSQNRELTTAELTAIQRDAEKQSKVMNLNQVCLCFQAYIKNEIDNVWIKICEPVFSNVINNLKSALFGELRITRMSTYTSQASGGQEVFMFVEKVCKNNIKVRFYEQNDDGKDDWEAFGIFTEADVHHQYGIVLKTPPYKKTSIDARVTVKVQLFRPRDGSKSEPLDFEYKPNVQRGGKRRRSNSSDFIPTVIGSHESSSQDNTSSSFSVGRQYQDSQNFGIKSNQSGNQSYELEESLFPNDSLPNYFGTFTTADLDLSANDLKGVWQCSPEEFCRLLDIDIGGDSKLEIDGAGEGSMSMHPTEFKVNCSLLEKLKIIIKMFRNNFDDVKLQEMLKSLIDAEAETSENILLDCIEQGSIGDIKDIVLILVKYKLKDVLQSLNGLDQNCIHLLILAGYGHLLKLFLNLGVEVNQVDAFGQTPLHLAVLRNDKDSIEELFDGSTTLKLNELNDEGFSPLHLAVMEKNITIVKLLIKCGADLHQKNPPTGDNVLHLAVAANKVSMPLVKLLIDFDEQLLHEENNARRNALQVASTNGQPNEELMHFLQALYEELYTNVNPSYEDETSSSESDNEEEVQTFNRIFDECCLKELCKIFDVDDKWKGILMLAGLEKEIPRFESSASPTLSLFQFFEQTNKSIESIQEILDMMDEKRAIETIDAMLVRNSILKD